MCFATALDISLNEEQITPPIEFWPLYIALEVELSDANDVLNNSIVCCYTERSIMNNWKSKTC